MLHILNPLLALFDVELVPKLAPERKSKKVKGTTVKGTTVKGTTVKGTTVKGTTVKGTTVNPIGSRQQYWFQRVDTKGSIQYVFHNNANGQHHTSQPIGSLYVNSQNGNMHLDPEEVPSGSIEFLLYDTYIMSNGVKYDIKVGKDIYYKVTQSNTIVRADNGPLYMQ